MANTIQMVRSQIRALQADVATLSRYRATLENARAEVNRVSVLLQRGGAASHEEYDQRRAAWLEAEANVRTAQENIARARATLALPLEPQRGERSRPHLAEETGEE